MSWEDVLKMPRGDRKNATWARMAEILGEQKRPMSMNELIDVLVTERSRLPIPVRSKGGGRFNTWLKNNRPDILIDKSGKINMYSVVEE